MTIRRLKQEGRLSGAVIHGNLVYLASQVADPPDLDAEGQTADVLRQIDTLLAEAGTDKSRLLSCQVFLADMADVAAMNKASTLPAPEERKLERGVLQLELPINGLAVIEIPAK